MSPVANNRPVAPNPKRAKPAGPEKTSSEKMVLIVAKIAVGFFAAVVAAALVGCAITFFAKLLLIPAIAIGIVAFAILGGGWRGQNMRFMSFPLQEWISRACLAYRERVCSGQIIPYCFDWLFSSSLFSVVFNGRYNEPRVHPGRR